jgi:hypothetical protein
VERRIQQNYRGVLGFLRPVAILMLCATLLCAAIAQINGQTDLAGVLTGTLIIFLSLLALLSLVALVLIQPGVNWFITDSGLRRVTSAGAQMVPWARIYRVGKTDIGYFVRWRDPKRPGISERDLEHKGILQLSKTDADELISLWQQNTSREVQVQAQAHFQSTNRNSYTRMSRLAWVMIVAGTSLFGWGTANIARQYPSSSWPSVEGKIISQQYRLSPQKRRQTRWNGQLLLSYEYLIADKIYRCDQYSLWQAKYQEDKETADAFARDHQRGTSVRVYYDPKHPVQAVLLPGTDWRGNSSWMGLGLCAVAFGLFMLNIFSKLMRGQRVLK